MKSTKFKTKQEKGITLMALIITIVVLLVLATVAISSIQNDGIISKAQDVANKFNQAQANEQNMLAEYLNYLNGNDSNGGNGSGDGELTEEDLAEIDLVERYVLGPNKTGRLVTEVLDESTGMPKDEASTIPNASTAITIMSMSTNADSTKGLLFIKYKDKVYKAVADLSTYYTESVDLITGIEKTDVASLEYWADIKVEYWQQVEECDYLKGNNKVYKLLPESNSAELIYEKKGREGQTVEGGTYDGWIILTDRDGLVEIVSPDTVGEPLTLGHGDTSVTATIDIDGDGEINDDGDKAILSYNNAITRINNYCKEVMGMENVRSVGGTDNSAPAYHSTNYDNWGEDITVDVASGDNQYELDFVKLSYFGKVATTNDYWLASRIVVETTIDSDEVVVFLMRNVGASGAWLMTYLWNFSGSNMNVGFSPLIRVRPVVINPSGI